MCHFLAPVGQPEMMHKNFMRRHLRISVALCSGMKFFCPFSAEYTANQAAGFTMNQRLQRVDKPHPCHSEERSDVGIRIFLDRNLRKTQNLCVLETDCHASVRTGSQ